MRTLRSPLSVTVAALAAALVLASCGSDEPTEDAAPSTATSTPAEQQSPAAPTDEPTEEPAEEVDEAETIEVVVEGDSISPNTVELSMSVGDELVLDVTSDREGEFHVHARPESYLQFGPGRTTERIAFENPGTVEIEEHDSGFVVALVRVR